MGDRVSKAEVEKASKVHVLDYLEQKGESIIKQGHHYYRHAEHDSLVCNTNGKWFWNSRGTGGMGAISLARELYQMKFQEAVRDVNSLGITKTRDFEKDSQEQKGFVYPIQYETNTIENAMNYLVKERCIDEKVVLALKKHELIAEDKKKNIVFKWRDKDGKIIGGDRQGTQKMENKRGTFKQIMEHSQFDGGFTLDIGKPNKIAVFESPIDLISYYDLKRPENIRLLSMSGLKDQTFLKGIQQTALECKDRGEQIKKIIIAVDNDKAGRDFTERWKDSKILQVDIPQNKDWNDDLKMKRKKEKEKENQKITVLPFSKNKELQYER